jgi:LysR family hydrogen peroxide-inducible transcriptional activator
MSERPSTRQLEYLVALADHLNFRRAAEACFVTQPTLSTQLKQLETVLGVQLFERDTRRVLPTPAGEALAARARVALRELDDLVAGARGFREPLAGPLRLGVIPTVAPYLLPAALSALRQRFPHLRLFVREDPTDRLLEQLHRGELDLLLLAREASLGDATTLDLFRDPFWLAVPRDHRLAKRKRVREADLTGEQLVLLEDGH